MGPPKARLCSAAFYRIDSKLAPASDASLSTPRHPGLPPLIRCRFLLDDQSNTLAPRAPRRVSSRDIDEQSLLLTIRARRNPQRSWPRAYADVLRDGPAGLVL